MLFIFALLLIVILVVLVRCIVIVPQSNAYVTEWLGVYKDTWGAGLHIRTPFVERISRKVSLKEEAADFPPQPVITRDNVTMMIDTVVFFQVFDAKMYAYGVNRPIQAIELAAVRFCQPAAERTGAGYPVRVPEGDRPQQHLLPFYCNQIHYFSTKLVASCA